MLTRQTQQYLKRFAFLPPFIKDPPAPETGIFVVIPCYNEPDLPATLDALWACQAPRAGVEVLVVLNASARATQEVHTQNQRTFEDIEKWERTHQREGFGVKTLFYPDLPVKHAGVGLARKLGLDEAISRLAQTLQEDAILINLDADCLCDPNYLLSIESFFAKDKRASGCTIYFEHPLEGTLDANVYTAIAQYELYLRYYVLAVRYAGHPSAYHTVGSTIALRAKTYRQIGGMNKRRAAEDFYFLQKLGQYGPLKHLTETRVIPASRVSDRNPFGTGPAVGAMVKIEPNEASAYQVYNPASFIALKGFLDKIAALYQANKEQEYAFVESQTNVIKEFLEKYDFVGQLHSIRSNTASKDNFLKRFYGWFNAFMVLKWIHHFRDHQDPDFGAPNIPVNQAAQWILSKYEQPHTNEENPRLLLEHLRTLERQISIKDGKT